MTPDPKLLDAMRSMRANLQPFGTLYPYALGRIHGALEAIGRTPRQKVDAALEIIAALDLINLEPVPEKDPVA